MSVARNTRRRPDPVEKKLTAGDYDRALAEFNVQMDNARRVLNECLQLMRNNRPN